MAIESQSTTSGTVTFTPAGAKISERERNDAYINGILNGETTVKDASGEYLPVMGFWNGKEYARATQADTSAITTASIKQISIDMPSAPGDKAQTRYFRQLGATDGSDNKSGLNASAWEEIDRSGKPVWVDKGGKPTTQEQGKREIRFSVTGVLEPLDDIGSLNKGVQGQLNPQAADMATFTGKILKKADAEMGKGSYEASFHSHSYGSVNIRAARAVTELHGVPSPTRSIMFDAGLIGDMQSELLQKAMTDPKSDFYKAAQTALSPAEASAERMRTASANLDKGTLLLVPIGQDSKGRWHSSAVANAVPGEGWSTGIANMFKDGAIGKDHGIEGSNNRHGDVVFVKVKVPEGYGTTAAMGGSTPLHQEVPTLYSVISPDNLVVASHTPNGKPPITYDGQMQDFARASAAASPVASLIKSMGGNVQPFIESAAKAEKGDYLESAKLVAKALASIVTKDDKPVTLAANQTALPGSKKDPSVTR